MNLVILYMFKNVPNRRLWYRAYQTKGLPLNVSLNQVPKIISRALWVVADEPTIRYGFQDLHISKRLLFARQEWLYEAIRVGEFMQQHAILLCRDSAYGLVRECAERQDLQCGRRIQLLLGQNGLDSVAVLDNHLIRLFATCGSFMEANQAFNKVANPSEYTWTAVIAAHAKLDKKSSAFRLYDSMLSSGLRSSKHAFLALLQSCIATLNLEQGRIVHKDIIENGFDTDVMLYNMLVDMYVKCGSMEEAREVFCLLPIQDVMTWGVLIAGYIQGNEPSVALEYFEEMQQRSIEPNKFILVNILKACGTIAAVEEGRCIHAQTIDHEIESVVPLGSALVEMYGKCGGLEEAQKIFDKLPYRDVLLWGLMIASYFHHDGSLLALDCFWRMQAEGMKPNKLIFLNVLKACGSMKALAEGRCIHEQIIENDLQRDVFLATTFVDIYSKCGSLVEARMIFDELQNPNVVSWGAMISGYAQHGQVVSALECFKQLEEGGISPNKFIFSNVLKACGNMGAIGPGQLIHKKVILTGLQSDIFVGSSLIDMYAKCGNMEEACKVFDKLPDRTVVPWGAMIAGYAQCGEGHLALQYFDNMRHEGIEPNKIIFSSILKACGSIGAIARGRHLHKQMIEAGLQFDIILGNSLVDMYGKCGQLQDAREVFDNLLSRDVASWNAMLGSCAESGSYDLAMQCLWDMQNEGFKPNDITFTTVLAACSRVGLVDEGCGYFKSMQEVHHIIPISSHCQCMIELLGHAGRLNEAQALLESVEMDIIGWTSLLTASRKYGNVELGRNCYNHVIQIDPQHAGAYVLMSGILDDACLLNEAAEIEEFRRHVHAWKKPAKAWIEIDNEVHEFVVGNKSHPQSKEIYAVLKNMNKRIKEAGYTPKIELVLKQMSDKEKEDALCGHCERLAVAFGMISMLPGLTIRATKNLRTCLDCHNTMKIISTIEKREIIIKDAYCMHHFSDGFCSCGDYY